MFLGNGGCSFGRRSGHECLGTTGKTPFILAAGNGHSSVIETLLEAGAGVNIRCAWRSTSLRRSTALHFAARSGHNWAVNALLRGGAETDATGTYGHTPLVAAGREGHCSVVETLLAASADPNIRSNSGGWFYAPLECADGHRYDKKP